MLDAAELAALPYPVRLAFLDHDWVNGCCDLPVLWFYRQYPTYQHYWLVEYDVRYTGSWCSLFDELAASPADLLATTIHDRLHSSIPHWWPSLLSPGLPLPASALIRAFLPFCRLTRQALTALDEGCASGWSGHSEVLWPTALRAAGFRLEEIGGDGPYTPQDRRGRHYTASADHWTLAPGTFQQQGLGVGLVPGTTADRAGAALRFVLESPVCRDRVAAFARRYHGFSPAMAAEAVADACSDLCNKDINARSNQLNPSRS